MKGNCVGIALVTMLVMQACGPSGTSFRIKGTFQDMQSGELYIYNLSDENPRFDTITITNGHFTYRGNFNEVTPLTLVFSNGIEQIIFVGPGQDITYEATANDLKNYVVNGSEENKLMNKFRQETYTQNPTTIVSTAREYINANAESLVAIYLFDNYFLNNPNIDQQEIQTVLNILKTKQPNNKHIKDIDRRLQAASRCSIGKTLKDATLTLRNNTTTTLWAKEKEYNLIAFWSTWIPSGYDLSWQIRQLYDKHKISGKLRVVSISFDIERFRWEEITRNDSLSALEQYCDGLGFESPVAKQYGITTLPFFILTDRSHKIVATTTSYEKIKTEVEKKLNK